MVQPMPWTPTCVHIFTHTHTHAHTHMHTPWLDVVSQNDWVKTIGKMCINFAQWYQTLIIHSHMSECVIKTWTYTPYTYLNWVEHIIWTYSHSKLSMSAQVNTHTLVCTHYPHTCITIHSHALTINTLTHPHTPNYSNRKDCYILCTEMF